MERIVGWIDDLIEDGYLTALDEKATKLQARSRREARVGAGAFCVKNAKSLVSLMCLTCSISMSFLHFAKLCINFNQTFISQLLMYCFTAFVVVRGCTDCPPRCDDTLAIRCRVCAIAIGQSSLFNRLDVHAVCPISIISGGAGVGCVHERC